MLDLIDIRTLAVMSSLISLVLSICMLYVSKTRKTYEGFGLWTAASVMYSFALGFMSLRNILPDFLSIIVSNCLIVAGICMVARGMEAFTNSARRGFLFLTVIVTTAIVFYVYTYAVPDVNARIIFISAIITILYGYTATLTYRNLPRLIQGQNLFLVLVFFYQAGWSAVRAIEAAYFEGPIFHFMNASSFHALTFAIFFTGNILIVVGLIVLNFQRVEFDLSQVTDEVKTLRGIIPICSYCKQIRDDQGYWSQVEAYVGKHTGAEFSHSICPACLDLHHPEVAEKISADNT